jgi:hypothetical protein
MVGQDMSGFEFRMIMTPSDALIDVSSQSISISDNFRAFVDRTLLL